VVPVAGTEHNFVPVQMSASFFLQGRQAACNYPKQLVQYGQCFESCYFVGAWYVDMKRIPSHNCQLFISHLLQVSFPSIGWIRIRQTDPVINGPDPPRWIYRNMVFFRS